VSAFGFKVHTKIDGLYNTPLKSICNHFAVIKIAAVQGAPKYLDLAGTLGKMIHIVEEAADNGCKLIAFPEAYIPGYPYWVWLDRPCLGQRLFQALYHNSVQIPGPAITELSRMAQQFQFKWRTFRGTSKTRSYVCRKISMGQWRWQWLQSP
jgi:hypothetical protein